MDKAQKLSDKWIKASILGTIWAASEIVLGSFLHNLRIPFSGNILTAIGIIILISASYKWKENGIFWRAGVICALLKTMSPSAVIFGPMIAILSEALLLEFTTRFLGRTIPGFILGAILAMSWNLFQKVFKLIIFYGNNIIEVYTNLMEYAEQQMGLQFDAVWTPLLLLLLIQILFGATAALIGIRTGIKTVNNPVIFNNSKNISGERTFTPLRNFPYSVVWMVCNLILMAGSLILIGRINFIAWVVLVLTISVVWAFRYKRALRQLVRPRLWIFFIAITMITALVFTRLQAESKTFVDALVIGVEMNLRAIVLLIGFTVLGTELYNPVIRNYFARSYFKQLPVALQLSLNSLPTMIANTPDLKTIIKNPTLFVNQIMAFADFRLNEISKNAVYLRKVYVITGGFGKGKTTFIKKAVEKLHHKNISVSGIYSKRIIENEKTIGYDVLDVTTGVATKFLRTQGHDSQEKVGKYFIYEEGFKAGEKALENRNSRFVVIDEIGKLENNGKGWATSFKNVLDNSKSNLILSLREEIVDELIEKFELNPNLIINVTKDNIESLF